MSALGARLGAFVCEVWGGTSTLDDVRARARHAEAVGLDHGWFPYLPWSLDALSAAQAAGDATSRLALGTAVIPTYVFHPMALARQAATVNAAIGGRLLLGVGPSQKAVIESIHGLTYTSPARHTREYIAALHACNDFAVPSQHRGEFYSFASFGSKEAMAPSPAPVLVGALGPRMLRVAAEVCDGTIAAWTGERGYESMLVPTINAAAAAAGRPAPRIIGHVPTCVTNDIEGARQAARELFGYAGVIPNYARQMELSGVSDVADLCSIGDAAAVGKRLASFAATGMTDIIVAPFTFGEAKKAQLRETINVAGDLNSRGR